MRLLFALLLIIVGVTQISATANHHNFDAFDVHSKVGTLAEKYPMTELDKLASGKAVQHAEYYRRVIHTGIGTIPPLDPYRKHKLKPINLDGNGTELVGTLLLSDVSVTGAAAFSVANMEVYLKTHRLDFDLTVPKIVANARFSAVNMMYHGLVFNTSGSAEVVLESYQVKGAVSLVPNLTINRYTASGLEVHIAVKKGWYATTTPIGNPAQKDVIYVRDAVFREVSAAVLGDLSNVLVKYTMQQFNTFMEP